MKNLFAFALLICSCLLIHAADSAKKISLNKSEELSTFRKKKIKTRIHIRIGRPSKDCYGLGFCYMTIDQESETNLDLTNSILETDLDNGTTTLYLKNLQGKQFNGYFHIEKPTVINEKIGRIRPNIYEMSRTEKEIEGESYLYKVEMELE